MSAVLPFLWKAAQNWGPSLAQQESAQDLLCNPSVCQTKARPILDWARQLPGSTVRPTLLPQANPTLLQQLLLPLLPWGLRQPWAHDIPVSLVLQLWLDAPMNNVSKESRTMNLALATEIVRTAVEHPGANAERANTLAQQWFHYNEPGRGAWMWDVVAKDLRDHVYDGWANFGLIAVARDCRSLDNPSQSLMQTWSTTLSTALKEMNVLHGSDVLVALLASELSNKHKLLACKLAGPQSWLNSDVHGALRDLLPQDDMACYPQLPFAVPNRGLPFDAVGDINRRLAQLYCPSLTPFFEIGLSADQWTVRQDVLAVHSMVQKSRRPTSSLALPDLLEDGIH